MLQIILCEDDNKQRSNLENIIVNYQKEQNSDVTLALSAGRPQEILDFLKHRPNENGLYFLDIDLQHELNGIDLAMNIREKDFGAKIVFITTYDKMAHQIFKLKIEALDYIIKDSDDIKERMEECLSVTYERHKDPIAPPEEYYSIRTGKHVSNIPIAEILFFETDLSSSKRIILHTKDGRIMFRGIIKEIAEAHKDFFLCHKSIVVHVKNIKSVDKPSKSILLINGETAPVSTRKMAALLEILYDTSGRNIS